MATDSELLCSFDKASQQAVQGRAPHFLVKSSRQTACVPLCVMMCACFMHRWSVDITPCLCVCLLKHTCSWRLRGKSLAIVNDTNNARILYYSKNIYLYYFLLLYSTSFFFTFFYQAWVRFWFFYVLGRSFQWALAAQHHSVFSHIVLETIKLAGCIQIPSNKARWVNYTERHLSCIVTLKLTSI